MAEINNTESNTLLSGTSDKDTIYNGGTWKENGVKIDHVGGSNVTINGGGGNDYIDNYGANTSINAGDDNDFIGNVSSNYVTIIGGDGNDKIQNYNGHRVSIIGGKGNDSIENTSYNSTIEGYNGDDYIYNRGENSKIDGGTGNDTIHNSNFGKNVTINAGDGNDLISNSSYSPSVKIEGSTGHDSILNGLYSDYTKINSGDGNDYIQNYSSSVTINGSTGNDTIYNGCYLKDDGSIYYYNDSYYGSNVLFKYSSGDGNDIIYGFKANSTLSIAGGSYSTTKSGDDVIVTVGTGKITLIGAASLSAVNIKFTEASTESNEWKLNGTTATYGTSSETLVTVSGVKSLSGISLSGKVVTVSKSALGTSKVTISNGYTLKLANDVTKTSTKKAWSYSNSTATYKQTTSAGYKLASDSKSITYSKAASSTLTTVAGVKSTSGLSLSGKVVTVAASSLNQAKVTVSSGYTLALADDVTKTSTSGGSWNLNGSTATYKSSSTSAGYTLASDSKSITYTAAKGASNLVTVTGVKATSGLSLSGTTVTISKASLNAKKVTVSNGYTLALADDVTKTSSKKAWSLSGSTATYKQTIAAGYKLASDSKSISYAKKATTTLTTVKGVKSTSGLSVSGKVVTVAASSLNQSKVTVSNGYTLALADDVTKTSTKKAWSLSGSTATYKQTTTAGYKLASDAKSITYTKKATTTLATVKGAKSKSGFKLDGKTIKLATSSLSKNVSVSGSYAFEFASDYNNAKITGSASDDTITAAGANMTINGGKGNDSLTGGTGADVFVYKAGDGNDIITNYDAADKISIESGAAQVSTSGDDVIFTVGSGKITVKGGNGKTITYFDESGNENIYPQSKPESEQSDVKFNASGSAVTLTATYEEDEFNITSYDGYANKVITIDASAVKNPLSITGNKKSNTIKGTSEDDSIYGGAGGDTITGGKGNDALYGEAGNDSLSGGANDDSLWGGAGSDTLTGGAGNDIFYYDADDGNDIITDYSPKLDTVIILSGDVAIGSPIADSSGDVTFKIGIGQIIFKDSASKHIELVNKGGNVLKQYNPG